MAGSLISMFTAPVLVPVLYSMANHRSEKTGNDLSSLQPSPAQISAKLP
ncbi:MAG TPA: hypothetical protein VIM69_06850 [Opitutaceae bacterium]